MTHRAHPTLTIEDRHLTRKRTEALLWAGVAEDDIHLDHASSAHASRPQLNLLLQRLREGDLQVKLSWSRTATSSPPVSGHDGGEARR